MAILRGLGVVGVFGWLMRFKGVFMGL